MPDPRGQATTKCSALRILCEITFRLCECEMFHVYMSPLSSSVYANIPESGRSPSGPKHCRQGMLCL